MKALVSTISTYYTQIPCNLNINEDLTDSYEEYKSAVWNKAMSFVIDKEPFGSGGFVSISRSGHSDERVYPCVFLVSAGYIDSCVAFRLTCYHLLI